METRPRVESQSNQERKPTGPATLVFLVFDERRRRAVNQIGG